MALTMRSLEALRVPTRAIYSEEKNTIRKLFPRPLDGHNLSVLVETQDLTHIFDGVTRAIGERVLGDEDTDVVAFLKAHLHPPEVLAGGVSGGHFTLRLKEAMANPASVGVLLGIARFPQSGIHPACRLHNPKWLPKLTTIAAHIYPPKLPPGSKTLGELDADARSRCQQLQRDTAVVVDEDIPTDTSPLSQTIGGNDTEETGAAKSGAAVAASPGDHEGGEANEAASKGDCGGGGGHDPQGHGLDNDSPLVGEPKCGQDDGAAAAPPQTKLSIELIHIEECASPLRYRKYLEPLVKRKKKPLPLPKRMLARGPLDTLRRSNTGDEECDERSNAAASRRAKAPDRVPVDAQDATAVPRQAKERDKGHRLSFTPQSNVLTRRQLRAQQSEQETASSTPLPEDEAARGKGSREERRAAAQQRRHRDAKRQQREHARPPKTASQSTSDQPPIFHVVDDEPGKRPRSLFLRPDNEKKRKRKPRVIVIN